MKKIITFGVSGALGRMGQRILALSVEDPRLKIGLCLERADHPEQGRDCFGVKVTSDLALVKTLDGLIDFSSIEATLSHAEACGKFRCPMVIGTTGLGEGERRRIKAASQRVPIVFSPNMSIGVNLLFALVREAASKLPGGYMVAMTEAHHIHKKDAPSGTAKYLADIDIRSIREGEIVGDHEVVFESPWDTIRLSHSAKTRDIFALGALAALKFIVGKKPGLYSMTDVLAAKKIEG
jgi:4-hydroxy-tetrahydrodipicolinate reductase